VQQERVRGVSRRHSDVMGNEEESETVTLVEIN
jgi:hypothetical protein